MKRFCKGLANAMMILLKSILKLRPKRKALVRKFSK